MAIEYIGYFSNIQSASFKWRTGTWTGDSDPLDDVNYDGSVHYKVEGYPYSHLHNYGIVANDVQGYKFVGWFTLSSNRTTTAWYNISQSMLSSSALSTSKSFTPNSSSLRTFNGWVTTGEQYYLLYAKYTNRFTITLDRNGGTGGSQSVEATYGQPMPQITVPTRDGYTFVGYFDTNAESGGTQYYSSTGSSTGNWDRSDDTTLYARWSGNELIATYNPNGGTVSRYFDRVRCGGRFSSMPTPQWGTNQFIGWFTDKTSGTQVTTSTIIEFTEDFVLYARWDVPADVSTVTFNPSFGTVSESSRQVETGTAIGSLPTPTRAGYTFLGWFLTSAGGSAIDGTYVVKNDVILYAQWTGNYGQIMFDGNGGTPSEQTETFKIGNQYQSFPSCSYEGKSLIGWFTSSVGGTQVHEYDIYNGSVTRLYARWTDSPPVGWFIVTMT